jgi:hypothetical protein
MPVMRGLGLGSSEQSMGLPPLLLVQVLWWSELSVAAGEEASTSSNKGIFGIWLCLFAYLQVSVVEKERWASCVWELVISDVSST